jgi:glycosyltransferase involved in cell wall biosynthesis
MSKRKTLQVCFIATVPDVLFSFMSRHIQMASQEMKVSLISNTKRSELLKDMPAVHIPLDIERRVSLWKDLKVLVQLIILFRREEFSLVHSIMPKTGLFGMMAAWIARVPCRIHTFTGQVWANKRGIKRSFLKLFDRLIVLFSTHIIVDSPSQRDFLEAEGIVAKGQTVVFGHGSICGVDDTVFHPNDFLRASVRSELDIGDNQLMLLYLGRLNIDKGIIDLAQAFRQLVAEGENVVLVLVGNEENVSFARIEELCAEAASCLRRVEFTSSPERYMAAADIFCLPSYREGFGQVIIEAAACEVPTVASRIYGVTDAIDDGKTGLLFSAGDVGGLKSSLNRLIADSTLRLDMGKAARKRTSVLFNSQDITNSQMQFYKDVLTEVCA